MIMLILRHAWLNLWDKHMTTGRINQVVFSPSGLQAELKTRWIRHILCSLRWTRSTNCFALPWPTSQYTIWHGSPRDRLLARYNYNQPSAGTSQVLTYAQKQCGHAHRFKLPLNCSQLRCSVSNGAILSWKGLSLIHIWRCRRSYACRSRWSPYH